MTYLHFTTKVDDSEGFKLLALFLNLGILFPLQIIGAGWCIGLGLKLAGL